MIYLTDRKLSFLNYDKKLIKARITGPKIQVAGGLEHATIDITNGHFSEQFLIYLNDYFTGNTPSHVRGINLCAAARTWKFETDHKRNRA